VSAGRAERHSLGLIAIREGDVDQARAAQAPALRVLWRLHDSGAVAVPNCPVDNLLAKRPALLL
jgi:hypothetical protein